MVRIRLQRYGTTKRPFYRIVVCDARTKRDGRVIEFVGWYNPISQKKEHYFDNERINYWKSQGAQPSNTVKNLLKNTAI